MFEDLSITQRIGRRRQIFTFGKDRFALDQCRARLYTGIARHAVLVMAALAICAVTAARLKDRADTQCPGTTPVSPGQPRAGPHDPADHPGDQTAARPHHPAPARQIRIRGKGQHGPHRQDQPPGAPQPRPLPAGPRPAPASLAAPSSGSARKTGGRSPRAASTRPSPAAAGKPGVTVYPHRFRHHFSHTRLDRGGAERDLMELNGCTSPQMLTRYGASARGARARRSYDRIMDDTT